MAILSKATNVGKFGARTGWGIVSKIRFLFLFSMFAIIIVNAILISLDAHSVEPGIRDLGGRFLYVTKTLDDESLKIIDRGSIYPHTGNILSDLWMFITSISGLFTAFYIIYFWIKILSFIAKHFIIFDDSKTAVSYIIGIGIFFTMQILLIVLLKKEEGVLYPFVAMQHFFEAIKLIIPSATKIADKFVEGNTTTIVQNAT